MIEHFIEIVPDFMDWFESYSVDLGGYVAGGILVAFLAWVLGATAQFLLGLINQVTGK